ncbi:unnamed protein product [Phytophthora fragariaefolia]|uniref:Unnamed protein product n=1 Tax=Phytophthora fragariaefolia TaxID=1490495 RepID=A0A9W6YG33_9STRA|nr:unnamed protein product [Phytophthora fragariaefolia]
MEAALGRLLPQLEIRFKDLSLEVNVVEVEEDDENELPTIKNYVKKRYGSCSTKKTIVRRQILKGISGVFKPGTATLVLGQPGSGKSALMKVLSGRFAMDKNVVLEGDITYNGIPREELLQRLPQFVSYVAQTDNHFPTLSVRETLEFAHIFSGDGLSKYIDLHGCNSTPDTNQTALEAAQVMQFNYLDMVIKQLGLQTCQGTVVGDNMLRGISGGEKKRVTTGEMEFGNKLVCMMDKISTGLDSATTFDIISTQRSIAKKFHKTVVISLVQPSHEVFALFDNVLLMSNGEVLYHGPCKQVLPYFKTLGFVCPSHGVIPEFLVALGTDKQLKYQVNLQDRVHPRLPLEFAEAFACSAMHITKLTELYMPQARARIKDVEDYLKPMPEFQHSFWADAITLLRRQLLVTVRNRDFLRGKAVLLILMGLLYPSVFYQFDFEDVQVVLGLIFYSIMYLALVQTPILPVYFAGRGVFYKQRRANFYRTASYVVSMSEPASGNIGGESRLRDIRVLDGRVRAECLGVHFFRGDSFLDEPGFLCILLLHLLRDRGRARGEAACDGVAVDICALLGLCGDSDSAPRLVHLDILDRSHLVGPSQSRSESYGMNMGEYYLNFYDLQSERSWIVYGIIYNLVTYFFFIVLAYRALEYKRIGALANIVVSKRKSTIDYVELSTPKAVKAGKSRFAKGEIVLSLLHREKQFRPITVAFQDLWYTVPNPSNKSESVSRASRFLAK